MSEKEPLQRYSGEKPQVADNSLPYPVSRMAPAVELVDMAREIAAADAMLGNVTQGKLKVIAEQIRALQQEARRLLDDTRRDQLLHRARCNFQKKPGNVYHLYRLRGGELQLSMLSPQEWGDTPPYDYVGSYRLENDMSWSDVAAAAGEDHSREIIEQLLALPLRD